MGIKRAQIDKMKCHIPKEKINTSKKETTNWAEYIYKIYGNGLYHNTF